MTDELYEDVIRGTDERAYWIEDGFTHQRSEYTWEYRTNWTRFLYPRGIDEEGVVIQ